MIIKAIKCEKPASRIKNYIDITRPLGRGVFEVLRQTLSPVMTSSYNQNRCCINCTRHTEEKLNTKFTYQLRKKHEFTFKIELLHCRVAYQEVPFI